MAIKYRDIFFDLDRTLWDFDRNSSETLSELYSEFNLDDILGVVYDDFISVFRNVNRESWASYRSGYQSKEELRYHRFYTTFHHFRFGDEEMARRISDRYMAICPLKQHLIPGSLDVLERLSEKYRLHIISNGFSDTQRVKIDHSGLKKYFIQVIISDETPFRKPQREIFRLALFRAQAKARFSVMVGDDPQKDIMGAKKAGLDQVFFNAGRENINRLSPTYEIANLQELNEIL